MTAAGTAVFLFLIARLHSLSFARSLLISVLFLFTLAAFKFGRLLMMDMPMAFFLTAVAYSFVRHWRIQKGWKFMALAGFLTGIAFLLKGPLFHVYAALLFLSQAGMRLRSPAALSNMPRLRLMLSGFFKDGLIFSAAALIVPFLWVGALAASGHTAVLWFFFVVENAGKFAADNQPMMRIFGGWLLYLMPFTLPALWIAARSFLRPVRGPAGYTARVFFVAAILITLLHLLPDRKDPYYVIPVLPLVIVAVGLSYKEDRIAGWLLFIQSAVLALFLSGVSDPMSGFFGIRRETFEQIADRLNPKGFKILLEILARARGRKVREVGYRFRNRLHGQTKLDGNVVLQYFLALLEIRPGRTISTTFLQYALIGSAGVFVNLAGQFLATAWLGLEYQRGTFFRPSLAVLSGFELSVTFNYTASNFWTFKDRKRTGFTSNLTGFVKFHLVALYGFLIQISVWNMILSATPEQFPAQEASYAANLVGILFATVNNYYLNKNFTWGRNVDCA